MFFIPLCIVSIRYNCKTSSWNRLWSKDGCTYLECSDGSYYTGSTTDLNARLVQHQAGEGSNHTKKRLPVKLLYYEGFQRIDDAFHREKQVQKWSRKKKEALMNGNTEELIKLAECMNETHCKNYQGKTTLLRSMTDRNWSLSEAEGNNETAINSDFDFAQSPKENVF